MPNSRGTLKKKPIAAKKKAAKVAPKAKKSARSASAVVVVGPVKKAPAASKVTSQAAHGVEAVKKSRSSSSVGSAESLSKMSQKWATLFRKSADEGAAPYAITSSYEPKTAIMHKVLGWGYILSNRNDRLEVLFKDGIKYLISNYKRD